MVVPYGTDAYPGAKRSTFEGALCTSSAAGAGTAGHLPPRTSFFIDARFLLAGLRNRGGAFPAAAMAQR